MIHWGLSFCSPGVVVYHSKRRTSPDVSGSRTPGLVLLVFEENAEICPDKSHLGLYKTRPTVHRNCRPPSKLTYKTVSYAGTDVRGPMASVKRRHLATNQRHDKFLSEICVFLVLGFSTRKSFANLPPTADDVLVGRQLFEPHRPTSVQLVGADANLRAKAKFGAVSKSR